MKYNWRLNVLKSKINHNKLSKATTISSESRGLYPAILFLSSVTWIINILKLVLAAILPAQFLDTQGSSALRSYLRNSSIKVFFISARKEA